MRSALVAIVIGLASAVGTVAESAVVLELVAEGLTKPLGFVQDPSDTGVQYIVQQDGVVRIVQDGALLPDPFVDISGVIGGSDGEHGLLGLAFPFDYATSGACYLSYTDANDDNAIARIERSADNPLRADIATLTPLLGVAQPNPGHNGGHIDFGPDGMLYIAIGDGVVDANGQSRDDLLGCILRIDVSDIGSSGYAIPPDNPFVGAPGVRTEIWSYGLRNPWRFTFDTGVCGTNAMLIADVGQSLREEINYEPAGAGGRNYGWSCREGDIAFAGCGPPPGEAFTDPVFVYNHSGSRSITGGFVYRGARMPHRRGRYFYADYITGQIWSLDLAGGVASDNQEHLDTSAFISSFGRDASGELYITDYAGGRVLRLTETDPQEDLDTDPVIDARDLGLLLGDWGRACSLGDINNDGVTDAADLGMLLGAWSE